MRPYDPIIRFAPLIYYLNWSKPNAPPAVLLWPLRHLGGPTSRLRGLMLPQPWTTLSSFALPPPHVEAGTDSSTSTPPSGFIKTPSWRTSRASAVRCPPFPARTSPSSLKPTSSRNVTCPSSPTFRHTSLTAGAISWHKTSSRTRRLPAFPGSLRDIPRHIRLGLATVPPDLLVNNISQMLRDNARVLPRPTQPRHAIAQTPTAMTLSAHCIHLPFNLLEWVQPVTPISPR
jgi:hypothetical protein